MSEADGARFVDLDRHPLDRSTSPGYAELVRRCSDDLERDGRFDLEQFVDLGAIGDIIAGLRPLIDHESFLHRRTHNVYFQPAVAGLAADHPALREVETSNRTVCADRMTGSPLLAIYEWPPLRRFLADAMGLDRLYLMADPLARVNVMSYRHGEALNWHFDRSEFTTTLLLQAPIDGGVFEYRTNLRTPEDPNHEGVGRLVDGLDEFVQRADTAPGTLTVFAGRDTAHRVTPVIDDRERIVAVFSFFDRPDVVFSAEERLGFYGRA